MNIAYIMRGVPGSGKSTVAKQLKGRGAIYSTDNYFCKEGVYRFDPTLLVRYHRENLEAFSFAVKHGIPVVI